jgi:hypothetical protein
MKFMLSFPRHHIIYLIVKLSRINLMFKMFEDYFVAIRPFIGTP